MTSVVVETLRPLMWLGQPVQSGCTIKVDALQAQHLLDSGRARLAHLADKTACVAAVRADVAAQLKRSGAGRIAMPPEGWPWHSV